MIALEIVIGIIIFLLGGMGVMVRMLRHSGLDKIEKARQGDMDKITETLNNLVAASATLKLDVEKNYVRKEAVNGHLREIRAEQEGQRKLIHQKFNHLEKTVEELKNKIGG